MRVAVHFPDGSVAAYKYGRVEEGVHNIDPLTGQPIAPINKFVQKLAALAAAEFPDADIVVERMVMDPKGAARTTEEGWEVDQSIWVPAAKFNAEEHVPTRPGNTGAMELNASTGTEAR